MLLRIKLEALYYQRLSFFFLLITKYSIKKKKEKQKENHDFY